MPDGSPTTQQDDDAVACDLATFGRLKAGGMPPDAAWNANRVAVFKRWFARGGGE